MGDTVVIAVNYDSGRRLGPCLESVLAQEPRPAVLVVDNASRDGSADHLPQGVRSLRRASNDGFAAALQDGLAASGESLVFTLNPDARLLPGCLAEARAVLEQAPDVAAVAPLVLQDDGRGAIDAAGVGLTSSFGILNHLHGLPPEAAGPRPTPVLAPLGGAALWRREALERVGGFDPWHFLYWEDMDLALRLLHAGYRCLTAPRARVLHEGSGIVGRWSSTNVFHMVRNHGPCLLSSLPAPTLRRGLPALLLAPLRASALYGRRGRLGAALSGLAASVPRIPGALARRRRLGHLGDGRLAAQRLEPLLAAADADRRRMKAAATGDGGRGAPGGPRERSAP